MQCLLCPETIDHEKVIHPEHVTEQKDHAAKLSEWKQLTVDVWIGRGMSTVLAGHICPKHTDDITKGRLKVSLGKKVEP